MHLAQPSFAQKILFFSLTEINKSDEVRNRSFGSWVFFVRPFPSQRVCITLRYIETSYPLCPKDLAEMPSEVMVLMTRLDATIIMIVTETCTTFARLDI